MIINRWAKLVIIYYIFIDEVQLKKSREPLKNDKTDSKLHFNHTKSSLPPTPPIHNL